MPPKKKEKENENWRWIIENTALDDETWNVKVIMIEAAGSELDTQYVARFEAFAAFEKRYVIRSIGMSETVFMINQLGVDKNAKDGSFRVFEEGLAILKETNRVPPDVMALIIKHLIIKIKEDYLIINQQRLEVLEGLRRESLSMISKDEVRDAMPPPSAALAPPPASGKGKDKKGNIPIQPEPVEGKKYNTVLRERGEEWRDRIYVDDFPSDGPNIYVAVSGFKDPYLPLELLKIGVPVNAVVQVRIDPQRARVPSAFLRPSKRTQSDTELHAEKNLKFWEELQELRIDKESSDILKDTAFIIFKPPYWQEDPLSVSSEVIYDELSFLMYDVQDLSRQHKHYLDNMMVIHIPEENLDERYYSHYSQHKNDLPLECETIFSLLDGILRTVTNNYEESHSPGSTETTKPIKKKGEELSKVDEKVLKAKNLVRNMFNSLCVSDADKKTYRVTYGEEYEAHKDPVMIKYGDFVKYPTFHLNNINLDNIVGSVLLRMPLHNLWLLQKPLKEETEARISFHVNALLSCFERDDVETAELNRLLNILACRKLYNNRSSLNKAHVQSTTLKEFKNDYLKRSALAEPFVNVTLHGIYGASSQSFPSVTKSDKYSSTEEEEAEEKRTSSDSLRIKSLFACPDISELVSAAEIANDQPISHMIDDFEYFEDFKGPCAAQILLDAFNKFNCVDYKYCEITNSIILMFYTSHDKDGISREEWRCHIPTPLCLQDFFDFVLKEECEWIQKEEAIYDAEMAQRRKSESQRINDNLGLISCLEDTNVEADLIMEGSLKHQALEMEKKDALDLSEMNTTTKTTNQFSADSDNKSKKRTSENSSYSKASIDGSSYVYLPPKPFLGYDLSIRRVEVLGKDATYFSRDRTRINTFYTLLIPYNLEYVTLNIVPGAGNNEFWIHRALGIYHTPEILERCGSFRVETKDHVMINIKKQLYQVPIQASTADLKSTIKLKTEDKKGQTPKSKSQEQGKPHKISKVEIKTEAIAPLEITFYSFCITWPNGLITESVHVANSHDISHIKLYYLESLPHLDEEFRCISLNGEVLIFKNNGDVEVLCPDGKYILVTKCEKRLIWPEAVNSYDGKRHKEKDKEKDKKKDKDKGKDKDYAESMEEFPPEYELVINNFDTIETTGLRLKWIEGELFGMEKLLIKTATDFYLGETFSKRNDGTNILLNKDGVQVVTFPNKTKIISYYIIDEEEIFPEWTDEERYYFETLESLDADTVKASMSQKSNISSVISSMSKKFDEEETKQKDRSDGYISVQIIYTIEHANFTTVTVNKATGQISVDSPNDTSVVVDTKNNYKLSFDGNTTANFDGVELNIVYEACPECKSYTTCNVIIDDKKEKTVQTQPQIILIEPPKYWAKMKDSFCKKIVVDSEGNINKSDEACSLTLIADEQAGNQTAADESAHHDENTESQHDDTKVDWKSESSVTSHGKCREMYQAKNVRFIVMRPDLSCSELVHRGLLEQYKSDCLWKPWCYVNQYETFGDHRLLHSILTPISVTESEKWMMNSKLLNVPRNLYFKDLKEDGGKGFYHWMRPYDRYTTKSIKPEPVHTHKQPRAFVIRTLEQQWHDSERDQLKGAKELLNAILRYRRFIQSESETILHIPIIDVRLDDEKDAYRNVQAVARRIYEDLKERLEEDVEKRAQFGITTKPPMPEEIIEEIDKEEIDFDKFLEEERASDLKELEAVSPMRPALAKYWQIRARELQDEQFYLYLLREGSVPKYFDNVFGGAIWWEVNHLVNESLTAGENRKMICACPQSESGEGTSRTGTQNAPLVSFNRYL